MWGREKISTFSFHPICILLAVAPRICSKFPSWGLAIVRWHNHLSSVTSRSDLWCHVEQCDWCNLTCHVIMPGAPAGKPRREKKHKPTSQRKGQFWGGKRSILAQKSPWLARANKGEAGLPPARLPSKCTLSMDEDRRPPNVQMVVCVLLAILASTFSTETKEGTSNPWPPALPHLSLK